MYYRDIAICKVSDFSIHTNHKDTHLPNTLDGMCFAFKSLGRESSKKKYMHFVLSMYPHNDNIQVNDLNKSIAKGFVCKVTEFACHSYLEMRGILTGWLSNFVFTAAKIFRAPKSISIERKCMGTSVENLK